MKAKEIRELSVEELEVKLTDLKKDLFNLRLQNATNQLDNPTRIAEVKRDIASKSNDEQMTLPIATCTAGTCTY